MERIFFYRSSLIVGNILLSLWDGEKPYFMCFLLYEFACWVHFKDHSSVACSRIQSQNRWKPNTFGFVSGRLIFPSSEKHQCIFVAHFLFLFLLNAPCLCSLCHSLALSVSAALCQSTSKGNVEHLSISVFRLEVELSSLRNTGCILEKIVLAQKQKYSRSAGIYSKISCQTVFGPPAHK